MGADLGEADLRSADLREAHFRGAKFVKADLRRAFLENANLTKANLRGANLSRAFLEGAVLVNADLAGAKLSECYVYGVSAWGVNVDAETIQSDLLITPSTEPAITTDNLEVAQFVYLLLHNEKITSVIDTVGKKGVLILGRFTEERKQVLDAIRVKLRELGFVPMMFDSKDRLNVISPKP